MRTQFSPAQLAAPHVAEAEKSLRACMHCGICTATCPTYVLLGDERDGPRGRIVMMQKMLEGGIVSAEAVTHVDRCLSCLACRTACPSSVDYARLLDAARVHIETHYRRPLRERLFRFLVAHVTTRPGHLRAGLALARLMPWLAGVLPGRLGAMAAFGARTAVSKRRTKARPVQEGKTAVALLRGCVQQDVRPEIDEAFGRILARRGTALVALHARCCGAIAHHLGREAEAKALAKNVIRAFETLKSGSGVTAVTISATGCAAHLKDYPHLFRGDPDWEPRAEAFARKLRDVSELLPQEPAGRAPTPLRVAFHSACSAQNALRLGDAPEALLTRAGFEVAAIPEGHLCCGSAGTYSLLQPEISAALRARKLANIASVSPDVIATGNIGCLLHLGSEATAAVHYLELIDWAEGGAKPAVAGRPGHDSRVVVK